MGRLYQPSEVSKIVGVSTHTLKVWEANGEIPKATRIGINKRRNWHDSQVERIIEVARDKGYFVPHQLIAGRDSS